METDYRRLIAAIVVSVAIMVGWGLLFGPKKPPPGAEQQPAPSAAPSQQAATPAPAAPAAGTPAAQPVAPSAPEERVSLETPEFTATFSSWGGALQGFVLKGKKFTRLDEKTKAREPVNLVQVTTGEAYPLSLAVSSGQGAIDPVTDAALKAPMRITARDGQSVTFQGEVGPYLVTKRYVVTGKPYELALDLTAQAKAGANAEGQSLVLAFTGYLSPDTPKPGFFSGGKAVETLIPFCRAGEKTVRHSEKQQVETPPGLVNWIGMDHRYFVSALMGPSPEGECVLARGSVAGTSLAGMRIAPGAGQLSQSFKLYSGPKQLDVLRGYNRDLETAIDYGAVTNLFAFFARILLWVMRWFERVVQNWGVAIILLTFLVKLILYPLTHKSMQSMNEMRKLQPEVEKLKAKFGDDKEKLNLAVMQLYKQHNVNPLGGCLPMLLQMPIWLALYATLQTSVELYHEPFLWIRDLTAMDPYYILPVAMGVSSFVTQKMAPQPADNAQAKMMLYVMPIFFTLIMFQLPAGLTLYIFVNNLLSIAQQQILMRRQPPLAPAKA